MRILHSADWHLGRIFHAVHLTDDQAYILDQFVKVCSEYSPDVILITGDIYDRAIPPPEAVKLLDETLSRLIIDIKKTVMIISGNHDSPDRLSFGSKILSSRGLYIHGTLDKEIDKITLSDTYGPVHFYLLPYAEPSIIRECTGLPCSDHNEGMKLFTDQIRSVHPVNQRSVICGHAFVSGGSISDSERPLSVGGTGTVDLSWFDEFSFVALGHLHRSQWLNDRVHYAGSPMKYSFSETNHKKSVSLIDIDAHGKINSELIPLTPRHDVRCIKGTFQQIIDEAPKSNGREDYLSVCIEDKEPILDIAGKLREFYPNVLNIERSAFNIQQNGDDTKFDHRVMTDLQLFSTFYKQTTGLDLDNNQSSTFSEIIQKLQNKEREADI